MNWSIKAFTYLPVHLFPLIKSVKDKCALVTTYGEVTKKFCMSLYYRIKIRGKEEQVDFC